MITASMLYAVNAHRDGSERCYYCGASCAAEHPVQDYVQETFTNRDIVAFPRSAWVCAGCALSLGAGPDELPMLDGTVKARTNARGMQPRMYSWVLSRTVRLAGTKAHIRHLREAVLAPPEPPFAIVLADSGQKQLLFRAPVGMDREHYALLLEDQRIEVDVPLLRERLELATRLCAAIGKPPLLDCESMQHYLACETYFGSVEPVEAWLAVSREPLSRLAAWLCPNREDSRHVYPGTGSECGGVPATAGRTDRSEPATAGDGTDGDSGRGGALPLDPGESLR